MIKHRFSRAAFVVLLASLSFTKAFGFSFIQKLIDEHNARMKALVYKVTPKSPAYQATVMLTDADALLPAVLAILDKTPDLSLGKKIAEMTKPDNNPLLPNLITDQNDVNRWKYQQYYWYINEAQLLSKESHRLSAQGASLDEVIDEEDFDHIEKENRDDHLEHLKKQRYKMNVQSYRINQRLDFIKNTLNAFDKTLDGNIIAAHCTRVFSHHSFIYQAVYRSYYKRMNKIKNYYKRRYKRQPTIFELADKTRLSVNQIVSMQAEEKLSSLKYNQCQASYYEKLQNEVYSSSIGAYTYFNTNVKQCDANNAALEFQYVMDYLIYPLASSNVKPMQLTSQQMAQPCRDHINAILSKVISNSKLYNFIALNQKIELLRLQFNAADFDPESLLDRQVCQCTIDQAIALIKEANQLFHAANYQANITNFFDPSSEELHFLTTKIEAFDKLYGRPSAQKVSKLVNQYRSDLQNIRSLLYKSLQKQIVQAILAHHEIHPSPIDGDPSVLYRHYLLNSPEEKETHSYLSMLLQKVRYHGFISKHGQAPLYLGHLTFLKKQKKDSPKFFIKHTLDFSDLFSIQLLNAGKLSPVVALGFSIGDAFDKMRSELKRFKTGFDIEKRKKKVLVNQRVSTQNVAKSILMSIPMDHVNITPAQIRLSMEDINQAGASHEDLNKQKLFLYRDIMEAFTKRNELINKLVLVSSLSLLSKNRDAQISSDIKAAKALVSENYKNLARTPTFLSNPSEKRLKQRADKKLSAKESMKQGLTDTEEEYGKPEDNEDKVSDAMD